MIAGTNDRGVYLGVKNKFQKMCAEKKRWMRKCDKKMEKIGKLNHITTATIQLRHLQNVARTHKRPPRAIEAYKPPREHRTGHRADAPPPDASASRAARAEANPKSWLTGAPPPQATSTKMVDISEIDLRYIYWPGRPMRGRGSKRNIPSIF